ncbi:MAG: alpha/beta hydrolase [Pseudomonadota bacterium]
MTLPLVLVHGFLGGSDQWHLQKPLVRDRKLLALDLPGFGHQADQPALSRIEDYADWCLTELTARGHAQFDLMGHSMGGMIVQEMVHRAPDRLNRLILYATGATGDLPGRFEPIATSMDRARSDGALATARRIAATWFRDQEAATEYAACAAIAEKASLQAILAGLAAMQAWSGETRLKSISCETLVFWGDCDRTYAWPQIEKLWREIPQSHLAVLPGCAHAVHLEKPDLFNQILAGFLDAETP